MNEVNAPAMCTCSLKQENWERFFHFIDTLNRSASGDLWERKSKQHPSQITIQTKYFNWQVQRKDGIKLVGKWSHVHYHCDQHLYVCRKKIKLRFVKHLKVPISWLGILHIYNIWNPLIRIAIYLVVTVNTRSYRHTENISLDFEPNWWK